MSSTSEVGNAKNVANLHKLTEQVITLANYNPPVDSLSINNLQQIYSTATDVLKEVEDKRNSNKNAIAVRQDAFKNLKSTCTRIINRLEILGLLKGTLDQAKSLNRSIQGARKKSTETPAKNGEATRTVSTSRQSYTQQAENFGIFIQLLETIPNYNPDDNDLKISSLKAYHSSMISSTNAVDQTEAALNTKLIERDKILYAENTGLYAIAQNVKKYVKSLYGATSPEFTNISAIEFSKR